MSPCSGKSARPGRTGGCLGGTGSDRSRQIRGVMNSIHCPSISTSSSHLCNFGSRKSNTGLWSSHGVIMSPNIYSSSLVVILHFITYCSARRRRRWFLSSFFHMSNMGLWAGRQAKWDPLESRWFDLILLDMYDSMSVLAFKSSFVLSVKNIFGGWFQPSFISFA